MPRVDFYILPEQGNRENFTCDITSKIHLQKLPVYIHTASRNEADRLDELLWTWKDTAFVPHSLVDADDGSTVTIGWEGMQAGSTNVMINLSTGIPDFAGSFQRVVEVVPPNDPDRQQARERYRQYRQAGFELQDHKLR